MTKSKNLIDYLCFSDPRKSVTREFDFKPGGECSNVEHNVVVIEGDSYGVYSNGRHVSGIVIAAAIAYGSKRMLLWVDPRPKVAFPADELPGMKPFYDCNEHIVMQVDPTNPDSVSEFFDKHGRYELWTFAGQSGQETEATIDLEIPMTFEEAMQASSLWDYAITIDLDGMLIGFLKADDRFDRFYDSLLPIRVERNT